MSENEKRQEYEPDSAGESGEVEILEVVGIDDDVPAPSGGPHMGPAGEGDEVVFALDDDEADEPVLEEGNGERCSEPLAQSPPVAESEQLQRMRADYDNLRKRVAREREDFQLQANSSLIEGLLPVLDNFDRALRVEVGSAADGAFRAGMVMIYDQLHEALREQGLRAIDSVGQAFDPHLHDAVATDPGSPAPTNTIIEEYQRGYLFQNRVLRPARVKVSTNGAGAPPSEAKGGER